MSPLLPMQHISQLIHIPCATHTQTCSHLYFYTACTCTLVEFSPRPADWPLVDWLFCPRSASLFRVWFVLKVTRWWGNEDGCGGSFLRACWQWASSGFRWLQCYRLCLHPELSANEIQAFLIRQQSALVYSLCCPVAWPFAKPLLTGVRKQSAIYLFIYSCLFMTASRCKEDAFSLWKARNFLSYL